MSYAFDNKLPKTTTYWSDGEIFYIKNTNFFVSLEEGKAMAELLMEAMNDPSTKALVIDNREAKGAWPKEISQIWESDARYVQTIGKKKTATLTSSAITTMQTNRLSKKHGFANTSKAFHSDFNDEVKRFLLG